MIAVSDEILTQTLQEVIDIFLIPSLISKGKKASGELINTIRVVVENGKGEIKGRGYAYLLVNGRQPNKDQSVEGINHFTRWAGHYIFKDYVRDKGLSLNPYMIARKIALEGSKGDETLFDVLQSREVTQYIYTRIGQNINGQIRADIQRRLKNTFKNGS